MAIAMAIKINDKLFDVLSSQMKILFYIGVLRQCTLSELREATQASWSTINRIIPELQQAGLIEITEEKTSVGSIRKVVRLSKKGEAIFNKLLELNDLLNSLDSK